MSTIPQFISGLVFGFDLGTGSIGYAVRRGTSFLETGSFICDSDIGMLDGRNGLRRQRRTLRSKRYRRQWITAQLERIGLPRPTAAFWQKQHNESHQHFMQRINPVVLRCRALAGDALTPTQLHVAIAHLWKRRGYEEALPWSKGEREAKEKDEWKGNIKSPTDTKNEFTQSGYEFPAQFLARLVDDTTQPQRRRVWLRSDLQREFEAIVEKQESLQTSVEFPQANGGNSTVSFAHWLLYGDGALIQKHGKDFRVFFKRTEGVNPGVLGLKWPRFNNRSPGLDVLRPYDEEGRPQHVVGKDKPIAKRALWLMAIANFRVIDLSTGRKVAPDAASLKVLEEIWLSRLTPKQRQAWDKAQRGDAEADFEVTVGVEGKVNKRTGIETPSVLQAWASRYAGRYALIEGQKELSSQSGDGRTRYSTPTLEAMLEGDIEALRNPPQPLLVRPGQTLEQAMDAYLADVRSPLVRHRLQLFRGLLKRLTEDHGRPDHIVIEAARSFGLGRKKKEEHLKEIKKNEDERTKARNTAKSNGWSTSKNALLKYRLWQEVNKKQGHCPFCDHPITQADLLNGNADIAHIVPQAVRECNEYYNLTVAHTRCNRMDMQNRIPRDAFPERWPQIEAFAREHFTGKKLELFLSQSLNDALEILDSKEHLCQTAYIARMIRRLCIIQYGWQGTDGRDPSDQEGNVPGNAIMISNGSITSMLRHAWGLNPLLHGSNQHFTREQWRELPENEKKRIKAENEQRKQKNRGDHRHHAIDAMVLACTLPWLARRVLDRRGPEDGELVWWTLDPQTRERRSWNPLFPRPNQFREVVARELQRTHVKHHVPQATHRQPTKTTLFARRGPDTHVVREDLTKLSPTDLVREGNRRCRVHPSELGEYLSLLWQGYSHDLHAFLSKAAQAWQQDNEIVKGKEKEAAKEFNARLCYQAFDVWRSSDRQALPVLPTEALSLLKLDMPCKVVTESGVSKLVVPERQKMFKSLPANFQKRLCFTAFQRWREKREELSFPESVRIPIVKVRYIAKLSDGQAVRGPKSMPGNVYVQRTDFREVRLMRSSDGQGYLPVFIPLSKHHQPESPFGDYLEDSEPVMTIRKRQRIRLVQDYNDSLKAGEYLVEKMSVGQITLSLPHVARVKAARAAFNLPGSGYQPYWKLLIPALGFPFPVSAQDVSGDDEDELPADLATDDA